MSDEDELFSWSPDVDPSALDVSTLIMTLGAFIDAGHAQHLLRQSLLSELAHRPLGQFSLDEILDHRDSRPPIIFDENHFEGYETPTITLHEVTDELEQHFLLLDGPEPALRWEGMARAIERIIRQTDVRLSIVTQSIPMAAPHTRPVQVTRWASRPELILGEESPFGRIQMPASFPAMLSQRLAEHDHDVLGLAAHVPHYLSDLDYPDAARGLLDAIRKTTGLALPSHALAMAAGVVRAQISNQVDNSEELSAMVHNLEEQYDSQNGQREIESKHVVLPSADDIGAEAEAFLRAMDTDSDSPSETEDAEGTGDAGNAETTEGTAQRGEVETPEDRHDDEPSTGAGPSAEASGQDEGPDDEGPYRPRHGDDSWHS
ncbi:PAC2 family protein [Acidipropionibacterium jensenii]|uniref:PAC2 family protein n=1 Tax=Acidipropionibacterium jensenii TaxID=1749 RepID=UPI000BC2CBAF|nr:PAC2 family protein [Acidipropionibacterium jensenii]AZZ42199.1 PAC2 family protein [Acidipropionibacterium jensenii]